MRKKLKFSFRNGEILIEEKIAKQTINLLM